MVLRGSPTGSITLISSLREIPIVVVQVTQAEQNQRHNLFHTKGVVKERSVRVIIDG